MKSWEIHIEGQVQGVGFRPFVYSLAAERGLRGCVSNGNDGVRIRFNSTEATAVDFSQQIVQNAPLAARITATKLSEMTFQHFEGFTIAESPTEGKTTLLLTPDLGLCADCRSDLFSSNRRKGYAFTTCTNCGPRYSIINALPYDRPRTSMADFDMCGTCLEEYHSPAERRYFSQTNSCPDCAVELSILGDDHARSQSEMMTLVVESWRAGKIVAIKGIGGYLLTCDAANEAAIQRLRARKYRPDKPLAVMFSGTNEVANTFKTTTAQLETLEGLAAPIVLLEPKEIETDKTIAYKAIAPELDRVGVMLPYAPLFQLLLTDFGRPIVATSGNVSGSPIVFREEAAKEKLGELADVILNHNRHIVMPQDDSVLAFTKHNQAVFLRRSRGYAPTFIQPIAALPTENVFAAGADMKSAFALKQAGNIYVSQYLGDLSSFDTQQNYQHTLEHLTSVLKARPEVVLADLHPDYTATNIAENYATENALPLAQIQHHEAHFAAVMLENELLETSRPVLGVIWDGTGYGTDGNIWGSPCFRYESNAFHLVGQLESFPHFAGDKLAREPRLSALAVAGELPLATTLLEEKFTANEWKIYQKLRTSARITSSSMGRLFDAVASLLDIADRQSYEGMAASRLEALARKGFDLSTTIKPYPLVLTAMGNLPTKAIVAAILEDQESIAIKAAKFHTTLVNLVAQIAIQQAVKDIAFSGGVFQNVLLVELLNEQLGEQYQLHFHHQLSPNDECIALGQLAHYALSRKSVNAKKSTLCV